MAITADLVKQLRDRSGAGMMECKKALVETDGDLDAAMELMRKQGLAKADKKAGRVAAEGEIVIATADDGGAAVMVEINSETDFVAGGNDFRDFARRVAEAALAGAAGDVGRLNDLQLEDGRKVEDARRELVAKVGENINVRRLCRMTRQGDRLGSYTHGQRIGVLVDVRGGEHPLARDLAMHIAASRPVCVAEKDVPADTLEKEREILRAQAVDSGKPPEIVEKMIQGRLRKYLGEITLLGQPFVKDPDLSVQKLLEQQGAEVLAFERFEVGEGIEKKEENFAAEVMAQVRDN
ncbi:MAG TPA: translation elongation factor Ts [Gammaproteobacteria bacterium]|nr:translation elongation factor Ts [Gammaproteobacteria bacterium]